jgi:hypothetical protein
MNLIIKSGPLGHFWTRKPAKKNRVLIEEKLDEIRDKGFSKCPHRRRFSGVFGRGVW